MPSDNCFALFCFVINAGILHVTITLILYFLIPKSLDLVSHNPRNFGIQNGPGSRDPGIAIHNWDYSRGISVGGSAVSVAASDPRGRQFEAHNCCNPVAL